MQDKITVKKVGVVSHDVPGGTNSDRTHYGGCHRHDTEDIGITRFYTQILECPQVLHPFDRLVEIRFGQSAAVHGIFS